MNNNDRILLVSDDEALRWPYLQSLASISRNVEFVSDGNEALDAVEEGFFDVVLLDIRTPGPDGATILRKIKQRSPDSEVVVITSCPTIAGAKEAVRLGAYDYVARPLAPDDMITLSGAALTHKRWALHAEHRP